MWYLKVLFIRWSLPNFASTILGGTRAIEIYLGDTILGGS